MTGGAETGRNLTNMVSVAVPNAQGFRDAGKEMRPRGGRVSPYLKLRAAIFAALRPFHLAAERVGDPLHSVADSKDRQVHREDTRIAFWRIRIIDRAGTARKNQAGRFEFADLVKGGGTGENRGEHLLLADTAGNQLRILAAEIQHHDAAEL